MQIDWAKSGKARGLALATAALAAAAQLGAGLWRGTPLPANLLAALLLAGLTAFAFGARVTIRRWWGALAALGFVSVASFVLLHLALLHFIRLEPEGLMMDKSPLLRLVGFTHTGVIRGIAIPLLIAGVVFAVFARLKAFSLVWFTFCWGLCLVDCALYEFRGNVFTLNDIASVGTALNVAHNYRLQIVPLMIPHLILYIDCMALALRARAERAQLRRLPVRLMALGCAALALIPVVYTLNVRNPSTFRLNGIRRNSALMELTLELTTLRYDAPDGYTPDAAVQLAERYPARQAVAEDGQRPHVIAIMIEAFSDLGVLGNLRTDVDFMPFTRQLMQESVSGYALTSTLGGGTARSEWEFLTGNTMAFAPADSLPFRQFMGDDENSIVKVFENAGYHTIGMHPAKGNGYGRDRVYPALGFDEIFFLDDLDWGDTLRGFVTDSAFMRQVIELYENRTGEQPLFLFGVTIQNHGNYRYDGYPATVHLQGVNQDFPDVEQYLSLILETDVAIRELIEYFSAVDEPVQIVFFGDHQPWTNSEIYDVLGTRAIGQRYLVPFVMWDNYAHRVEQVPMTSLNFLPARLLELTGVPQPSYFRFLSVLNETVDAMNHMGYIMRGENHHYGDDTAASALLREYGIYQYANMFGDGDPVTFIGAPQ